MTAKQMIETLQQHHPHIGETEALLLLNQAKNEFCEDTGIYTSQLYTITTFAGTMLYELDPYNNSVWIGDSGSGILASRIQGEFKIKDLT
jgi:hypothetical protein